MKKKTSDPDEAPRSTSDVAGDFVQLAAVRVAPLAAVAADRLGAAAGRVSPLATQAREKVTPYAQQAVTVVTPYAHQAAERFGPLAETAKLRGAKAAHDAVDRFGPAFGEARDRVGPAVESARDKVTDDLLPKVAAALAAAAASPVALEATQRGQAVLAAARGELTFPPPPEVKKRRWPKRLVVVGALGGVAFVVVRKFLGSKDSDWQAARPTTPYTPPTPATNPPAETPVAAPVADLTEDTLVAETPLDTSVPEATDADTALVDGAPEGIDIGVIDEPVADETAELPAEPLGAELPSETEFPPLGDEPAIEEIVVDEVVAEPVSGSESEETASGASAYSGEGVYVGSEPPEGYVIKGNERSMKYHLPDSGGYVTTTAEVWFASEEAAQAAGFVRAKA